MVTLEQREIATTNGVIVRNIKMAGSGKGRTGLIMNEAQEIEEVIYLIGRGWVTKAWYELEKKQLTPTIARN